MDEDGECNESEILRDVDVSCKEKLRKYESDYARRLKAKYFSMKTLTEVVKMHAWAQKSSRCDICAFLPSKTRRQRCTKVCFLQKMKIPKACFLRLKNGGDIFDYKTTIGRDIIKSSRWPCTRSFVDPVVASDLSENSPFPAARMSRNLDLISSTKKSC